MLAISAAAGVSDGKEPFVNTPPPPGAICPKIEALRAHPLATLDSRPSFELGPRHRAVSDDETLGERR